MSPAFVPSIKELAKHLNVQQARKIAQHAIGLRTTSQVKRYMTRKLREISPSLGILDTM